MPFNDEPRNLTDYLAKMILNLGWEEKMYQAKLLDMWNEIVGESASESVKIDNLKKGVLTLKTEASAWRSEMKIREVQIIEIINQKLKNNVVKELKIR
jgi:predicted nucleic acid-binding Zn ribbon protein